MTHPLQEKLQHMWNNQKLSLTEIAHELGVTRSVISGMVNRMRAKGIELKSRTTANHSSSKGVRRSLKVKLPDGTTGKLAMRRQRGWVRPTDLARKTQFENVGDVAAEARTGCSLIELTSGQCRYPSGDPKTGVTFCGEPLAIRSYCRAHYDLCYYPSKGKDG